ncbi:MAG: copper chaperone PCu(A)C [Candidatus Competibacteraceae bacterium]|nr:copper chaperone PCu(A)C [Candidatus Competibacteraceae bacterium]MBK8753457.1 copper chaperone PCu(A)C [Candidatus Competibacteraceae bacterium]
MPGFLAENLMKKTAWLLLSALCVPFTPALAAEPGAIQIETPWARESPPAAANGAAYMTLVNTGGETDHLLSASGEVAETVELHTHLMENNVMKMRKVEAIEVAHGEPTVLRPGGLHIMLIGLKKPLVAGQTFPLTLRFEKAGETSVQVTVRGKDAAAMPDGHAHHQ